MGTDVPHRGRTRGPGRTGAVPEGAAVYHPRCPGRGVTYLLDADIVNYLIKGVPAVRQRFREAVVDGAEFVLSPIVHYQVTRHLKLKGAARLLNAYVRMVSNWLPATLDPQD